MIIQIKPLSVRNSKIKKMYIELGSVWSVGKKIGLSGQQVHRILNKIGVDTSKNKEFTEDQINELIAIYKAFEFGDGSLNNYCKKHGIDKPNVCRKAKRLGLTNKSRKQCEKLKKNKSKRHKKWHEENEHPKGMLGKTHTKEIKKELSIRTKKLWEDENSVFNSDEFKQKQSNIMSIRQSKGLLRNGYSRGRQGKYNINGNVIFFRSLWEANYALFLDFLIKQGEIEKWEFESETFWFEEIKRGVRSYKPDFKVFLKNNQIEYHEVKGWMDSKSKTKLNRMRIYHPNIKIVLIDQKRYTSIKKSMGKILNFFT